MDGKTLNPYAWAGDSLIAAQTGRVVATVEDFPQLIRQRELNRRENERRARKRRDA